MPAALPPGAPAADSADSDLDDDFLSTPPAEPASALELAISGPLFHEWLEQEILRHFPLVQAAARTRADVDGITVEYSKDWRTLKSILHKLGYEPAATDPWQQLGFAR